MVHFTPGNKNALFVLEQNGFKPEITFCFSFWFFDTTKSCFRVHPQLCVIFLLSKPSHFAAWPMNQNLLNKKTTSSHTSAVSSRNLSWKLASIFPWEEAILIHFYLTFLFWSKERLHYCNTTGFFLLDLLL